MSKQSYPSFTTRLKAAYIRALITWTSVQAVEQANQHPSEHAQLRAVAIWGLAKYLAVLGRSRLVMTDTQVDEAYRAGRVHLEAYQTLRLQARRDGVCLYHTRPKWHYFDHSLEYMRATAENPRFFLFTISAERILLERCARSQTSVTGQRSCCALCSDTACAWRSASTRRAIESPVKIHCVASPAYVCACLVECVCVRVCMASTACV
jgi:hypothetical protein